MRADDVELGLAYRVKRLGVDVLHYGGRVATEEEALAKARAFARREVTPLPVAIAEALVTIRQSWPSRGSMRPVVVHARPREHRPRTPRATRAGPSEDPSEPEPPRRRRFARLRLLVDAHVRRDPVWDRLQHEADERTEAYSDGLEHLSGPLSRELRRLRP
jgi:hypothetical protein